MIQKIENQIPFYNERARYLHLVAKYGSFHGLNDNEFDEMKALHYSSKGPSFVITAVASGCHPKKSVQGWRSNIEFCPEGFCSNTGFPCVLNDNVFNEFWQILDQTTTEITTGVISAPTLLDVNSLIRLNNEEYKRAKKSEPSDVSSDDLAPSCQGPKKAKKKPSDKGRDFSTFRPRPLMHYLELTTSEKKVGQPWCEYFLFFELFICD